MLTGVCGGGHVCRASVEKDETASPEVGEGLGEVDTMLVSVSTLFPLLDRTVSLSIRRSVSFSLYVPSSTYLSVSSRFLFVSLSLLDFSLSLCLFVPIFFPALSLSLFLH
jgi:hypothetical protein